MKFHYPASQPGLVTSPPPLLARVLWQCQVVSVLAVLCMPLLGAAGTGVGVGAFWLLAAPACSLLALYRHVLAATWRDLRVPVPRRRPSRHAPRQAWRAGFGSGRRASAQDIGPAGSSHRA